MVRSVGTCSSSYYSRTVQYSFDRGRNRRGRHSRGDQQHTFTSTWLLTVHDCFSKKRVSEIGIRALRLGSKSVPSHKIQLSCHASSSATRSIRSAMRCRKDVKFSILLTPNVRVAIQSGAQSPSVTIVLKPKPADKHTAANYRLSCSARSVPSPRTGPWARIGIPKT